MYSSVLQNPGADGSAGLVHQVKELQLANTELQQQLQQQARAALAARNTGGGIAAAAAAATNLAVVQQLQQQTQQAEQQAEERGGWAAYDNMYCNLLECSKAAGAERPAESIADDMHCMCIEPHAGLPFTLPVTDCSMRAVPALQRQRLPHYKCSLTSPTRKRWPCKPS